MSVMPGRAFCRWTPPTRNTRNAMVYFHLESKYQFPVPSRRYELGRCVLAR